MNLKLYYLTTDFYRIHKNDDQILLKEGRPYLMLRIVCDTIDYYIPFRSNISHKHAFFTDVKNRCGLDFSKSVIITDRYRFVELTPGSAPKLRTEEWKLLNSKIGLVKPKFEKFLNEYRQAVQKVREGEASYNQKFLCQFSSLQYFHREMNLN